MFQHTVRPIVVHDFDIQPMKPFVYHLNHICYRLTKTVCSHHFLHVEFVPYGINGKKDKNKQKLIKNPVKLTEVIL